MAKTALQLGNEWLSGGWRLSPADLKTMGYEQLQVCLLTAILKELQEIHRLLNCPNVVAGFLAMQEVARLMRAKKRRKAVRRG